MALEFRPFDPEATQICGKYLACDPVTSLLDLKRAEIPLNHIRTTNIREPSQCEAMDLRTPGVRTIVQRCIACSDNSVNQFYWRISCFWNHSLLNCMISTFITEVWLLGVLQTYKEIGVEFTPPELLFILRFSALIAIWVIFECRFHILRLQNNETHASKPALDFSRLYERSNSASSSACYDFLSTWTLRILARIDLPPVGPEWSKSLPEYYFWVEQSRETLGRPLTCSKRVQKGSKPSNRAGSWPGFCHRQSGTSIS